ncbi:MAG: hypothetical protein GY820_22295 [Gammaproteobacteria bacterium]|nr:hypothetical protein [Gammaproteobacteria bacterium]
MNSLAENLLLLNEKSKELLLDMINSGLNDDEDNFAKLALGLSSELSKKEHLISNYGDKILLLFTYILKNEEKNDKVCGKISKSIAANYSLLNNINNRKFITNLIAEELKSDEYDESVYFYARMVALCSELCQEKYLKATHGDELFSLFKEILSNRTDSNEAVCQTIIQSCLAFLKDKNSDDQVYKGAIETIASTYNALSKANRNAVNTLLKDNLIKKINDNSAKVYDRATSLCESLCNKGYLNGANGKELHVALKSILLNKNPSNKGLRKSIVQAFCSVLEDEASVKPRCQEIIETILLNYSALDKTNKVIINDMLKGILTVEKDGQSIERCKRATYLSKELCKEEHLKSKEYGDGLQALFKDILLNNNKSNELVCRQIINLFSSILKKEGSDEELCNKIISTMTSSYHKLSKHNRSLVIAMIEGVLKEEKTNGNAKSHARMTLLCQKLCSEGVLKGQYGSELQALFKNDVLSNNNASNKELRKYVVQSFMAILKNNKSDEAVCYGIRETFATSYHLLDHRSIILEELEATLTGEKIKGSENFYVRMALLCRDLCSEAALKGEHGSELQAFFKKVLLNTNTSNKPLCQAIVSKFLEILKNRDADVSVCKDIVITLVATYHCLDRDDKVNIVDVIGKTLTDAKNKVSDEFYGRMVALCQQLCVEKNLQDDNGVKLHELFKNILLKGNNDNKAACQEIIELFNTILSNNKSDPELCQSVIKTISSTYTFLNKANRDMVNKGIKNILTHEKDASSDKAYELLLSLLTGLCDVKHLTNKEYGSDLQALFKDILLKNNDSNKNLCNGIITLFLTTLRLDFG